MKKLTTKEFIERSNLIHNNKYDYSLVNYKACHEKIEIICKEHGKFSQLPSSHTQGNGCPHCSIISMKLKKSKSHDDFCKELSKIHPELKVISEYSGAHNKIIVIDKNKIEYFTSAENLIRKTNPSVKMAIDKNLWFKTKSNLIHNDRYDYSNVDYVNSSTEVIINCKIHGTFKQTPNLHLRGCGCSKCNKIQIYTRSSWIQFCENKKNSDPKVYIVRCYNDDEEFVKIGITSDSVYTRFKDDGRMPYEYEVIKEIKGSATFVFDKEHELHRLYKKYKYCPKIIFGGHTECFSIDIIKLMLH